MNENIDLTKILKDCPEGTKFYSPIWGEVSFDKIHKREVYTIGIDTMSGYKYLTKEGYYINADGVECILFPSKDQRDWSKFTAPWIKNERFDPKTLQPFDKVLVKTCPNMKWGCDLFSTMLDSNDYFFPYIGFNGKYKRCIPLNDDTKHLVGTANEAPEFYRYWED